MSTYLLLCAEHQHRAQTQSTNTEPIYSKNVKISSNNAVGLQCRRFWETGLGSTYQIDIEDTLSPKPQIQTMSQTSEGITEPYL